MSTYSQLHRETFALLAHRGAGPLIDRDCINWAVKALVDGFDSPSLLILAGLDYKLTPHMEISNYFLKAVKELNLPIPDCELAFGNWHLTADFYSRQGLSLPDEATVIYQHLEVLAKQIKEGEVDPAIGLDRIYSEIIWPSRIGTGDATIPNCYKKYEEDYWEWYRFCNYVQEKPWIGPWDEPQYTKEEIMEFVINWLNSPRIY